MKWGFATGGAAAGRGPVADAGAGAGDFVVVVTTADHRGIADAIAEAVIERRQAACAQISRRQSVYRWQGEVCRAEEFAVEIKTTAAASAAVEATIRELHPYETPEILILPVLGGSADYLTWIASEVR